MRASCPLTLDMHAPRYGNEHPGPPSPLREKEDGNTHRRRVLKHKHEGQAQSGAAASYDMPAAARRPVRASILASFRRTSCSSFFVFVSSICTPHPCEARPARVLHNDGVSARCATAVCTHGSTQQAITRAATEGAYLDHFLQLTRFPATFFRCRRLQRSRGRLAYRRRLFLRCRCLGHLGRR